MLIIDTYCQTFRYPLSDIHYQISTIPLTFINILTLLHLLHVYWIIDDQLNTNKPRYIETHINEQSGYCFHCTTHYSRTLLLCFWRDHTKKTYIINCPPFFSTAHKGSIFSGICNAFWLAQLFAHRKCPKGPAMALNILGQLLVEGRQQRRWRTRGAGEAWWSLGTHEHFCTAFVQLL